MTTGGNEGVTRRAMARTVGVLLSIAASLLLAGCAGAVIGAGATVGVAAVQQRSIGDAGRDARIDFEINSAFLQKNEKLFGELLVDSVEGHVLLTGILDTEAAKTEAGQIAWKVAGVHEVINEIQVGPDRSIGEYARDKRIGTELRTELIGDNRIDDVNYDTVTIKGVVYLFGIAKDPSELDRVVQHVRNISGVRDVVNHVMLKDDLERRQS